jgi:cytochrome P450
VSAETSISVIDHHLSTSPILLASYNEALRFSTGSVTVRMVAEDCVINNVCLQKGSKLIIPYGQMAMDENVFGAHPEQFDHTRFLKNPGLAKDPSFRPFGGGITYCPGRFLAQKEALMVVAGLVGRFDVRLKEGEQRFPRVEMKKPCFGMMEAVKGDDFVVVLRRS